MNKIIKLSTTWCGPCKTYAPVFDDWALKNPDVDTESLVIDTVIIPKKWGIKSIPTTIVVDADDNIISKSVGVLSEEDLDKLKELI